MLINYLGILAGLTLLIYGADLFIDGAVSIARYLGMAPLLIGLTIVGLATSAPEILVGTIAALNNKTNIAIGNAIGSNIANIGLILGLTVIFIPVTITSRTLRREFFIMITIIILTAILMYDQILNRVDATILLVTLLLTISLIVWLAKKDMGIDSLTCEFEQKITKKSGMLKSIVLFVIGLSLLLGGAHLLVECAIVVARHFGISDLVIGLTIIAIGTSLPELAASIIAAKKNEADIAIGNVIGSNMFNMLAVIGIPSMIQPASFDRLVILRDFPVMIGLSLMMAWMIFIHGSGRFDRIEGSVLLTTFIAYQYLLLKN